MRVPPIAINSSPVLPDMSKPDLIIQYPIPEIVWLKNGLKLSSGANYIHAGKSSLDLVVLDVSDAGLYSCM